MRSGLARYCLGGILVVLGLLLLLSNLGLLPLNFGQVIAVWWPLLLLGGGLYGLVSGGWRLRSWAVILLLLGVLFQLAALGIVEWNIWAWLWPGLIILAGLLVLLRRRGRPRRRERRRADRELIHPAAETLAAEPVAAADGPEVSHPAAETLAAEPVAAADGRDFLTGSWTFGSGEIRAVSQNFQGGDLSVTFGGVELDLRAAALAAGGAALVLEVVFGGVKLKVPEDWQVIVASSARFGGVAENRPPPDPANAAGQLTITGKVVCGGLEIGG